MENVVIPPLDQIDGNSIEEAWSSFNKADKLEARTIDMLNELILGLS